jgi:predicted ester cyclase
MAISRQDFTRVWGDQALDAITDIYTPTYRGHGYPVKGTITRSQYRWLVRAFHHAFPDYEMELLELTADETYVYVDWVFRGTHTQSFLGFPASNATVEFTGSGRHQHANGRVSETWLTADWSNLYQTLLSAYLW